VGLPGTRGPQTLVGLVLAATCALGACTPGSGGSAASAVSPAQTVSAGGPGSGANGVADSKAAGSPQGPAEKEVAPAAPAELPGDKLVRTASTQVQVDDVEARSADVRRIAVASGGMVVSENSTAVPRGTSDGTVDKDVSHSVLGLAVPSDALDAVLDEVGKLGTTVQRSSLSRDVTSTYVDTQARVTSMKASLDQLRSLLAKTTALDQVISLETELSRRQADLDALQAQLSALDKKVSMSTLTVDLATAARVVSEEDDAGGFLGGLRHGWRAFLGTLAGVLTVLGAVLPFLLLVGAVGGPAYLWWRRRRASGRRHGGSSGASGSDGAGGAGGSAGASGGSGGSGPEPTPAPDPDPAAAP
jgi:hypothetical protein